MTNNYQFMHIESVSLTGRNIMRKEKNIGNISVDSVLGEAGRLNGYIPHIENPLPPVIVYGSKENGLNEVRQKIDEWVSGTTDARGHKIRKDAQCLLAGTTSIILVDENETIEVKNERCKKYEKDLVEGLKKIYGDELIMVIRHDDEPFKGINEGKFRAHWHFYCVKKPGKKFDLHPGFFARSKWDMPRNDRKKILPATLKALFEDGRNAYKTAMIEFQDKFYEEVSKKNGFERKGPCRIRRSRNEQKELEDYYEREIEKTKIEAKKIIINAENQAKKNTDLILKKIRSEKMNGIEQQIKEERDKIINNAELEANKIKDKAFRVANDITKTSDEQAKTIVNNAKIFFNNAKNFVNQFLDKVAKLPGGKELVEWIKTYIKPYSQNEEISVNKEKKIEEKEKKIKKRK